MDNTIHYLNTDLDLICEEDLTELANAFEVRGAFPLHVTGGDDGKWYATFETDEQHAEPDPNISRMLTIIESLPEPLRRIWMRCTLRVFDIGYDCGAKPWGFHQSLSTDVLARIAAAGASLRITLYPDRHHDRGITVSEISSE